ncbi:PHP domain-containing protein [Hathewaya limosa]|uniref:Metal-dependent phosphoesterase TrpH n=1 Tax=Hathewaya limosa TaxID=1536 RepID=A0ABU0JQ13_HATLI|nr:PHP domain-containing protein [Hathewaya limosa]MDQ0479182.1 putative metal-dependent phosphoesterase TrpH [Hathewaya limosa]
MLRADLHTHTIASDGVLTINDLLLKAKQKNLDIVAITDHDSIGSLDEALKLSKTLNIKVIPGIELTTLYNNENIHLLGYFKDSSFKDKTFQDFLLNTKLKRLERGKDILKKLKEYFNIDINEEKLLKKNKGIIARPHIAHAILEAGYCNDFCKIFDTFLSKTSPAYVPNNCPSLLEGINILKSVNALSVIAHPTLIKKNNIKDLMDLQFDGMECLYPLNKEGDFEKFSQLCKKYNKISTAGSDFHGIPGDYNHGDLGQCFLGGNSLEKFLQMLSK